MPAQGGVPADDAVGAQGGVPAQGGAPLDDHPQAWGGGPDHKHVPHPDGVPAQREGPGGGDLPSPARGGVLPSSSAPLPPSDAELIGRARKGDDTAYGELYRRHADAVRRYAATCCRDAHTADDLTAEVFAAVLQAVRGGSGPEHAVRAYLLTTVRRVAAQWTRTARREHLVEDFAVFAAQAARVPEALGGPASPGLPGGLEPGADVRAMHEAEQSLAVRAFRSLPERWQAVLWHTEVEDEPPSSIAPLFGLDANGTRVLAGRAREGLKRAYLQAHVSTALAQGTDCARHAGRLGAYARGRLRSRAERGLRKHLEECAGCRLAAGQVQEVAGALPAVVPIAVIGWFGAAGYAKALGILAGGTGATGAAAALGGAPSGGTGTAGAPGAGGAGGSSGATEGPAGSERLGASVTAGVAAGVAAVAATAIALAVTAQNGPAGKPSPATPPSASSPVVRPAPPSSSAPARTRGRTPKPPPPAAAVSPAPAPAAASVASPAPPAPSPTPTPESSAPVTPPPSGPAPGGATPSPAPVPPPPDAPAVHRWSELDYDLTGDGTKPEMRLGASSWVWQRYGMSVEGSRFGHGVTVHGRSSVTVALNGACSAFDARAGVDDLTAGFGRVSFAVYADGVRLWRSRVVAGGDPAVPVHVDLTGRGTVRLVVEPHGPHGAGALADWAESTFTCDAGAAGDRVDAGPDPAPRG
ncbi:sigma-70 family RNA polymerase sigma factor [Streptomyces sp. NPDC003697]